MTRILQTILKRLQETACTIQRMNIHLDRNDHFQLNRNSTESSEFSL